MIDYDQELYSARNRMTDAIMDVPSPTATKVAQAADNLHKAWDDLTAALNRQIAQRDELIRSLINQLAEKRKN